MSSAGDANLDKRKSKGRGSVNNAARLEGLFSGKSKGSADWGNCDPRWLQEVIVKIGARGGACTFGYSRDGGGHMLALLLDGERTTLWFNGDADLDAELEGVCAKLDTLG